MSLDFGLYFPVDVGGGRTEQHDVFDANITHNLVPMAREAGIYDHLWRPDENGYSKAGEIVEALGAGLSRLEAEPDHFKAFNSPNGWGLYEHFVPFVREVLAACQTYPEASIYAGR